jgi:hypothetical protein
VRVRLLSLVNFVKLIAAFCIREVDVLQLRRAEPNRVERHMISESSGMDPVSNGSSGAEPPANLIIEEMHFVPFFQQPPET